MASALATFAASVFKGTFNVEIQVGDNEPSEAAIRRFRRGVLNSGVLPEVRQRADTPGACATSGYKAPLRCCTIMASRHGRDGAQSSGLLSRALPSDKLRRGGCGPAVSVTRTRAAPRAQPALQACLGVTTAVAASSFVLSPLHPRASHSPRPLGRRSSGGDISRTRRTSRSGRPLRGSRRFSGTQR